MSNDKSLPFQTPLAMQAQSKVAQTRKIQQPQNLTIFVNLLLVKRNQ